MSLVLPHRHNAIDVLVRNNRRTAHEASPDDQRLGADLDRAQEAVVICLDHDQPAIRKKTHDAIIAAGSPRRRLLVA